MTSRDFCFWLQGYFEIKEDTGYHDLSADQVEIVKKHLALVFKHEIDPSMGGKDHQKELDDIHTPESLKPAKKKLKSTVGNNAQDLLEDLGGGIRPDVLYRC